MAHIELFILNYNGAKFLEECLESIQKLNLSKHTLGISVVDNNSIDNSNEITSRYQSINFIKLNKNYGFSRGNNLGVKNRLKQLSLEKRSVDYIAFLNNDTTVHSEWLNSAISSLEKDPSIGILGSKSVFYDSYIHFMFECSPSFNPSHQGSSDTRDLGIYLSHRSEITNIHPETNRTKRLGAYELDAHGGRWLKPKGDISLRSWIKKT